MRPINISSTKAIDYYYALDPFFSHKDAQWAGAIIETMGLSNRITKDQFSKILNGQDMQGNQIIKNGHGKDSKKQYKSKHRAAIDIALSAPKSVSILALHCGHEKAIDAHKNAVQQTIAEIEQEFIKARQTIGGKTQVLDAKGLFAMFNHSTSRANDPQLHTHVLTMNMCVADNKYKAVFNDLIYKNQRYINNYYQQTLASELVKAGYQIEIQKNGNFEIKGISEKVIKKFSKRTEQIEKQLAGMDKTQLNEAQRRNRATIESRQDKDQTTDKTQLNAKWELEYSARKIENKIQYGQSKAKKAIDIIQDAANWLHKKEASFNRHDLLNMAFSLSRGVSTYEIKKAFKNAIDKGHIQSTGQRITKSGLILENYATPKMIKMEKDIMNLYTQGLNNMSEVLPNIDLSPYDYFTKGQKLFVRNVFESKNQFNLVQGDAGTGKTSAMKAVAELNKSKKILGLAYTGKAASEIENKANIKSMTIDQLLNQIKKRSIKQKAMDKLSGKYAGIWLIDESSMIGSAQILKLMRLAKSEHAKVFFIGDSKQLQAIAAGKMFKELQTNKHIELTETLRQKEVVIKKAVELVKQKHIKAGLNLLKSTGNVIENTSIDEMISDYIANNGSMIITSTNADREYINQKTRQALKQSGLLHSKDYTFKTESEKRMSEGQKCLVQSYEIGQEIIINDAPGVQAGSRFIVTGINRDKNQIKLISSPTVRIWDEKQRKFKHIARKKRQVVTLNPMKSDLSIVKHEKKEFSKGERVIFTRNDNQLDVKNGNIGIIEGIRAEQMKIKVNDRQITINSKDYANIDHAHAITVYKSQGQTSEKVYIYANNKGHHTTEFLYTGLSRASHQAKIYCENYQQFMCQCMNEQEKQTSLSIG
ncbi:MAG: Mobilization protein TraI-like protein [Candidatus Magnetoglobus multicellularis str. Araruama]|uniref:Mobilization protein TraI-like protein n=1 Tax=Candidatus Magnetoglobus multicellularis str. Araruama TaxID=890399 RepID=A0A1V1P8N4_9BACT|nr:MAG: Mobilization protein TraI-like protein [Candidatus Magnetoglobus multicellularis str. Araruama]